MKNIIINKISKKLVIMGLVLTLATSSLVARNEKLALLRDPILCSYGILWNTCSEIPKHQQDYFDFEEECWRLFELLKQDIKEYENQCVFDFLTGSFLSSPDRQVFLSPEEQKGWSLITSEEDIYYYIGRCCEKRDFFHQSMHNITEAFEGCLKHPDNFDEKAKALNFMAGSLNSATFHTKASDLKTELKEEITNVKTQLKSVIENHWRGIHPDAADKNVCFREVLDDYIKRNVKPYDQMRKLMITLKAEWEHYFKYSQKDEL